MSDGSLPGKSKSSSAAEKSQANRSSGLFSGMRVVSLCTLFSRVLGLLRDVGMAATFGAGPILDAFTVAFRVPNLARRLFGEGALTAAFLPAFVREREQQGDTSAWTLATAVMTVLFVALSALVLIGEATLGGIRLLFDTGPDTDLLIGLTAVMLPYLVLICLAAQISAVLNALGHFFWPALLPAVLNIVWIAGIWLIAPLTDSKTTQVYLISGCILAAGFLQLATPVPALRRLGFVYHWDWKSTRTQVFQIVGSMLPVIVGLSITQLNTFADSLIAWGLAAPAPGSPAGIVGETVGYPFEAGTASALYFGQRMYQFPLGVFGLALGTVLFPLLSRHAERGRLDLLCDDLSLGLRLVIAIGFPSSAGLVLLARPLTVLLFQYDSFDAEDVEQTTEMIAAYGAAVWAYCGLLIVHRGYYAVADRQTPLRVGMMAVVLNLVLNLTLIWFIGGLGLAVATAIAAVFQVTLVTWLIQQRVGRLDVEGLWRTTLKAMSATTVMGLSGWLTIEKIQFGDSLTGRGLSVFVPVGVSIIVYLAMAKLLRMNEPWLVLAREQPSQEPDDE